jgi:hypothetical protein
MSDVYLRMQNYEPYQYVILERREFITINLKTSKFLTLLFAKRQVTDEAPNLMRL